MANMMKNFDIMDYENWEEADLYGKQKTAQNKISNLKAAARKADERERERERKLEREAADADKVVAQIAAKKDRSLAVKQAKQAAAASSRAIAHGGSDEEVTQMAAKKSYSNKNEYSKKSAGYKPSGKRY
jgi:esterase/lipase